MSFPVDVTSVLTGATLSQLAHWRTSGLLVPEVEGRPALYSFRDLVALRTVVRLRRETSLQAVRKAFRSLTDLDLTGHPSHYRLISQGRSVVLVEDDRQVDLVVSPGQEVLASMEDVFAPFSTRQGVAVADFRKPRPHLEVREGRMSGWPTIEGTRIPFDTIASLVGDGSVTPDEVSYYYPSVTPSAARDASSFAEEVSAARPRKAAG